MSSHGHSSESSQSDSSTNEDDTTPKRKRQQNITNTIAHETSERDREETDGKLMETQQNPTHILPVTPSSSHRVPRRPIVKPDENSHRTFLEHFGLSTLNDELARLLAAETYRKGQIGELYNAKPKAWQVPTPDVKQTDSRVLLSPRQEAKYHHRIHAISERSAKRKERRRIKLLRRINSTTNERSRSGDVSVPLESEEDSDADEKPEVYIRSIDSTSDHPGSTLTMSRLRSDHRSRHSRPTSPDVGRSPSRQRQLGRLAEIDHEDETAAKSKQLDLIDGEQHHKSSISEDLPLAGVPSQELSIPTGQEVLDSASIDALAVPPSRRAGSHRLPDGTPQEFFLSHGGGRSGTSGIGLSVPPEPRHTHILADHMHSRASKSMIGLRFDSLSQMERESEQKWLAEYESHSHMTQVVSNLAGMDTAALATASLPQMLESSLHRSRHQTNELERSESDAEPLIEAPVVAPRRDSAPNFYPPSKSVDGGLGLSAKGSAILGAQIPHLANLVVAADESLDRFGDENLPSLVEQSVAATTAAAQGKAVAVVSRRRIEGAPAIIQPTILPRPHPIHTEDDLLRVVDPRPSLIHFRVPKEERSKAPEPSGPTPLIFQLHPTGAPRSSTRPPPRVPDQPFDDTLPKQQYPSNAPTLTALLSREATPTNLDARPMQPKIPVSFRHKIHVPTPIALRASTSVWPSMEEAKQPLPFNFQLHSPRSLLSALDDDHSRHQTIRPTIPIPPAEELLHIRPWSIHRQLHSTQMSHYIPRATQDQTPGFMHKFRVQSVNSGAQTARPNTRERPINRTIHSARTQRSRNPPTEEKIRNADTISHPRTIIVPTVPHSMVPIETFHTTETESDASGPSMLKELQSSTSVLHAPGRSSPRVTVDVQLDSSSDSVGTIVTVPVERRSSIQSNIFDAPSSTHEFDDSSKFVVEEEMFIPRASIVTLEDGKSTDQRVELELSTTQTPPEPSTAHVPFGAFLSMDVIPSDPSPSDLVPSSVSGWRDESSMNRPSSDFHRTGETSETGKSNVETSNRQGAKSGGSPNTRRKRKMKHAQMGKPNLPHRSHPLERTGIKVGSNRSRSNSHIHQLDQPSDINSASVSTDVLESIEGPLPTPSISDENLSVIYPLHSEDRSEEASNTIAPPIQNVTSAIVFPLPVFDPVPLVSSGAFEDAERHRHDPTTRWQLIDALYEASRHEQPAEIISLTRVTSTETLESFRQKMALKVEGVVDSDGSGDSDGDHTQSDRAARWSRRLERIEAHQAKLRAAEEAADREAAEDAAFESELDEDETEDHEVATARRNARMARFARHASLTMDEKMVAESIDLDDAARELESRLANLTRGATPNPNARKEASSLIQIEIRELKKKEEESKMRELYWDQAEYVPGQRKNKQLPANEPAESSTGEDGSGATDDSILSARPHHGRVASIVRITGDVFDQPVSPSAQSTLSPRGTSSGVTRSFSTTIGKDGPFSASIETQSTNATVLHPHPVTAAGAAPSQQLSPRDAFRRKASNLTRSIPITSENATALLHTPPTTVPFSPKRSKLGGGSSRADRNSLRLANSMRTPLLAHARQQLAESPQIQRLLSSKRSAAMEETKDENNTDGESYDTGGSSVIGENTIHTRSSPTPTLLSPRSSTLMNPIGFATSRPSTVPHLPMDGIEFSGANYTPSQSSRWRRASRKQQNAQERQVANARRISQTEFDRFKEADQAIIQTMVAAVHQRHPLATHDLHLQFVADLGPGALGGLPHHPPTNRPIQPSRSTIISHAFLRDKSAHHPINRLKITKLTTATWKERIKINKQMNERANNEADLRHNTNTHKRDTCPSK